MAEFSKLVTTDKGKTLLAKMLASEGLISFSKISTSSAGYSIDELESLNILSDIKQTGSISRITRTNEVAVQVETTFDNAGLKEGYYIRSLGLYAVDPDEGEILYAVTTETTGNCYMPPYNGVTASGIFVKFITTVGNAENVSLEVNAAGVATVEHIQELQKRIDEIVKDNKELQHPVFEDYESEGSKLPEPEDAIKKIVSGGTLQGILQNTKAALMGLWLHDFYHHHDEENMEAIFLQNFTKVEIPETDAMTLQEIEAAIASEWNGEASEDPRAMTPPEIETATILGWDGESSADPEALNAADVSEATS